MPIHIIQENISSQEIPAENCYFCKQPTRTWHENTNNAVCIRCAGRHKVIDLPDYGQRIRRSKRVIRDKLKAIGVDMAEIHNASLLELEKYLEATLHSR